MYQLNMNKQTRNPKGATVPAMGPGGMEASWKVGKCGNSRDGILGRDVLQWNMSLLPHLEQY